MLFCVGCLHWLCYLSFASAYSIAVAQDKVADWPTVAGTLLKAELTQTPRTEFDVQFAYEVDGVEYSGDQFSLVRVQTGAGWDTRQIEELWDQQQAHGFVTVYYDPQTPARSVLYGDRDVVGIKIAVGAFCAIVVLVLDVALLHSLNKYLKARYFTAAAELVSPRWLAFCYLRLNR